MEELANLQKKFLEIQKSGGGFKLSERTVVEIINKIVNRKKIKINFTTNGREYVTDEKITKEIQDEILKNKGRVSKVALQKAIDVQSNVMEQRLNLLFSKDRNLSLIENNIITNYYFDNMAREINYQLQAQGSLLISEISNLYDLSINFFKKFLSEKTGVDRIIQGKLYPNRILTDDYIESQLKKIRPLLIGSIMPISFPYMIENFKIDEFIINDLVQRLLNENVVRGKINSNVFEPAIFEESKISYIKGCLSQNNYLEYNLVKNIGIKNPKEFLSNLQKDKNSEFFGKNLLFLKDFVITENLKNNFEYSFFENYSKNITTNLNNVFLFELSENDIFTLLEKINVKANSVILIDMNLIPVTFLDEFLGQMSPILKEEASKQYNNYVNKIKEKEKKKQAEKEAEESSSKNKKAKNQKPTVVKGKSNKKNESDDEDDRGVSNIILNENMLKEVANKLKNNMQLEDLFNKEETLDDLLQNHLKERLNKMYAQFINEFISSKSKTSTNDPKSLLSQIETEYMELKFVQKSIEAMNSTFTEPSAIQGIKPIVAYLCKKDLNNLFKNILTYQLIHMKSKIDLNKINLPNERKELINSILDDDIKSIFNKLNEYISSKNFSDFLNYLQANSKDLAISLSNYDKKKEKVLFEKYFVENSKNVQEKKDSIKKGFKKDYIAFLVDFTLNKLLSKNYFLKLPYEPWCINVITNIFAEKTLDPESVLKTSFLNINEFMNLSDDDFFNKHNEMEEFIAKILTQ